MNIIPGIKKWNSNKKFDTIKDAFSYSVRNGINILSCSINFKNRNSIKLSELDGLDLIRNIRIVPSSYLKGVKGENRIMCKIKLVSSLKSNFKSRDKTIDLFEGPINMLYDKNIFEPCLFMLNCIYELNRTTIEIELNENIYHDVIIDGVMLSSLYRQDIRKDKQLLKTTLSFNGTVINYKFGSFD